MQNLFALDAAVSPIDMIFVFLVYGWWIIAIAAVLVISAIIGIVFFTKKRNRKRRITNDASRVRTRRCFFAV